MFKPVHGIRGTLAQSITSLATAIYLDGASICLLTRALQGSDYTYLIIQTGYTYEIVKTVSLINGVLTVVRAQDGTTAQAFPAGSNVGFVLSNSAITDLVNQQNLGQINLTGSGIVTVTKTGPNAYNISAPTVTIASESDKILVGGDFPNFIVSSPNNLDCCD